MTVGAVFDCDGTLLDTMGAWRAAQDELARRAGGVADEALSAVLGPMTIPEVGAYFHEQMGLGNSAHDVVEMIGEIMLVSYREQSVARPGALEFVKALVERGVPCSVASSTPPLHLRVGLEATGFADLLTAIVSVDDVGASKRDPAVYLRACELMGTQPSCTWGFEDSLYALRTLKDAGFKTVGVYDCDVAGTFEELAAIADITVRSFSELDGASF